MEPDVEYSISCLLGQTLIDARELEMFVNRVHCCYICCVTGLLSELSTERNGIFFLLYRISELSLLCHKMNKSQTNLNCLAFVRPSFFVRENQTRLQPTWLLILRKHIELHQSINVCHYIWNTFKRIDLILLGAKQPKRHFHHFSFCFTVPFSHNDSLCQISNNHFIVSDGDIPRTFCVDFFFNFH